MNTSVSATPITNIMLDGPSLADTRRGAVALEVSAPMGVLERFWTKVDRRQPSECWPWTGAIVKGYGQFGVQSPRRVKAHRFAYELLVGPIPDGLVIDHLCRNRACVNPSHMEPVTPGENTRRGVWPNSQKTHCPKGHPYSSENTRIHKRKSRYCRACEAAWRESRRLAE